MKKLVGIALIFSVYGCAKLMEDQPGTADSTQSPKADTALETAGAKPAAKVPERFLNFYSKEFTGSVGVTGGSTHSIDVEMVMDVVIELRSEADIVFIVKKDGLDITEEPSKKWEGRLVPGRYTIAVIPGVKSTKFEPYSLTIREN